ncbi:sigma-54 interaction domain-containing protein [Polymorphobacter fuscus]|uniref:AAA domain-containing protein n=1 Tax=Sandarakinorhabdus fusca TaxID=1439888 RepID=A0A7C9GMD9_9SPHN|nr:sigma 54-interacting transcriptional regulator [Polymorphobacter fuscus]KAB7648322.1 AAA domain-containing protein [Polymorphobacter fuscus]MQT15835.1 AAA domain-containing protein [Polymorphobacter fuscus]
MNSSPAPLPLPDPRHWLPGLASIATDTTPVTAPGAEPGHGRRVTVAPAAVSTATCDGDRLVLAVAPQDHRFACALIAAFCAGDAVPAAADPASIALLDMAARVAAHDVGVIIEGATGTGKEGLARLVHTLSPRRDRPLVAVNCAALPEAMLEATLFGHERGAFSGAIAASPGLFRAADHGTLLLDEVSELPLPLQAKRLRVLQEREVLPVGAVRAEKVDVRVIAAANRDLAADVAAGRFRADLFYRLAVFPLRTIPLADRRADIVAIAAHWLLRATRGRLCWPTPAALARLDAHGWPGNVRELGNVLDRAMVLADGAVIDVAHLAFDTMTPPPAEAVLPLPGIVRHHEDRVIRRVLAETHDRRSAAQRLGISERTLRYKLAAMRPAAVQ